MFAVSPSVKEVQSLEAVFQLSSEYLFSNLKVNNVTYRVDFGDGKGEIVVKTDETLKVKYSTSGEKRIKFTAIDQPGHTLTCYSTIEIAPETNKETSANLKSVITSTTGSVTGRTYNGGTATIDYEIVYSGSDQILDKPFILVEGFDPFDDFDPKDNWANVYPLYFLSALRNQGYDVIFVNYQNSTDYIQRNAYALEELIKNVNQTKNQYCLQKRENVVMGLSMGGLVARYALCDLENRSENHDTRLYISYDSPQKGANVPLSFQKLVERLDDYWLLNLLGLTPFFDISQLEDAYYMLKSPAAQQMLVLGGSAYIGFYNELGSMGYPSCRNIALANGSMQSVLYPSIQYGNLLAELDVEITGGLLVNMDANCFALANNSNNRIYYDNFGIFQWLWVYAKSIPFDNAPGGIYDYADFGLDANDITDLLPGNNSQFNLTSDGFCFVPTASALGITLSSSTLQASVTSAGQTPFDNIFINNSSNNENHIELTTEKRNWILQQVAIGDVLDCDGSCFSISGPSNLCSSGGEFRVTNVPSGKYVSWSFSSNIQSYYGGNNWIALRAIGNGVGWVEATINNTGCGNITLSRMTVWAGTPVISYISGSTYTPNYQWATYHAQPNNPQMAATDYEWILSPLNGNSTYDYGWTADIAFYNSGYYQVVARAQNTCGWGSYAVLGVEVYDYNRLSISPNPSSGETTLTIETISMEKTLDETAEWDLEIYDSYQSLKLKNTKLKGKEHKIQTAGWKEGVYIVRVKYNNEILQGKLVVKK